MDLYSSDVGAIQEGNMRSQAVVDANAGIQQHNNDLGVKIAGLKSADKQADIMEGGKDMFGGFIATGKIKGKVDAYKNWTAERNAPNPTTQANNKVSDGATNESAPSTTEDPPSKLKDEGDGVFSSSEELEGQSQGVMSRAKSGIKNALGVSEESVDAVGKGVGEIASVGMAGLDIYKDIKAGGIAGDNWASKTSNILQIGGAIADVGGTVFPPLALLGGALDIASGVGGEIGDLLDSKKQDQSTSALQTSQTQAPVVQEASAPETTGRVS